MNGSHQLETTLTSINNSNNERFWKTTDTIRFTIQQAIDEGIKQKLPNHTQTGCFADYIAQQLSDAIRKHRDENPYNK